MSGASTGEKKGGGGGGGGGGRVTQPVENFSIYVLDCCKPVAGVPRVLGDSLEYRAQR